jgi:hypothetical protein
VKRFIVLSVSACLLLIICGSILVPGTETAAQAAQAASTPTPRQQSPVIPIIRDTIACGAGLPAILRTFLNH